MKTFDTNHRGQRGERPGHAARRGGALALVMIAVVAVAALSAGMFQLTGAVTKRQASSVNRKLSFYMAEAGLAEAYAGLVIGKTGMVGTQLDPARFGRGLFWVEATDNPDGTVTLRSTGMVGNGSAVLSLVVQPAGKSVATLGFFSDESLDVNPGARVDGWDSEQGTYGGGGGMLGMTPTTTKPLGRLGSNGTIQVTGGGLPTIIDGDARPGPGQQVVTTGSVVISGSTKPAKATKTLPPVAVPVFTPTTGITQGAGAPLLLLPGKVSMDHLTIQSGGQVVVQGPSVLVLGSLTLEEGGDITFDPSGGTIGIYVEGEVDLASGSTFEVVGEEAHKLVLQVSGTPASPVNLAARGHFYGLVYAPEADVEVYKPFKVYGSLVGKNLQLNGAVKLHFDENLIDIAAQLALPKLVSWRIIELSNPGGMGPGTDPFKLMGLDPTLLNPPAGSHASVNLKIDYEDLLSFPQTYDGPESAFDWTQVSKVTEISRAGKGVDPEGRGMIDIGGTGEGLFQIK